MGKTQRDAVTPNAFDVLKSAGSRLNYTQSQQKRRKSGAADQHASSQHKYEPCPVCSLSVPRQFLSSHVQDCLDKQERKALSQAAAAAAAAEAAAAAAPGEQHQTAGSHAGVVAGRQQRAGTVASRLQPPPPQQQQQHATGWRNSWADQQQRQQQQPANVRQQAAPRPAPGRQQQQQMPRPPPRVNAFAIMAAAAAAQQPVEASLFLEAAPSGAWRVHWWDAGDDPPEGLQAAWSAEVRVVLPKQQQQQQQPPPQPGRARPRPIPTGSQVLLLELATNLPSGYGTAVNSSNPLLLSNQQLSSPQQHQQPDAAARRWTGAGWAIPVSALQKCIRRGLADSATRIALELLKRPNAADQLLRRLAVICLEDGLLHPQLPLVVWAMMALGKGYVIGGSLADALLALTYQMAAVGQRDFLPEPAHLTAAAGPDAADVYRPPASWQEVSAALPPGCPEATLVRAVMVRAAFGGTPGDVAMMMRFAGLWLSRFRGRAGPPPALPPPPVPGWMPPEQVAAAAAVAAMAGRQLPGRATPACFEGCPAPHSPWLAFLRGLYQQLQRPGPGATAPTTSAVMVAALTRADIPLAAVDFHVLPNMTQFVAAQPPVVDALRALAAARPDVAAELARDGPHGLVNQTLWLFRSSINTKAWLPQLYSTPQQEEELQRAAAGGTALAWVQLQQRALAAATAAARAERAALQPLWRVMASQADAYARDVIMTRTQQRQSYVVV